MSSDPLTSPGASTAARADLEARVERAFQANVTRFLRAVLADADQAAAGAPLVAAAAEPFTLGATLTHWAPIPDRLIANLAVAAGARRDSQFLSQVARRLRDSNLPTEVYQATRNLLAEAVADPTSRPNRARLKAALRRELAPGKDSPYRAAATRIARTETTAVWGHVQSERIAAAPGWDARRWVSHLDQRTRPSHLKANGQVVANGEPFTVGGWSMMFPGDPNGPDSETANCFPADMPVYGQVTGGMRRWYSGPMCLVEVGGQQLAGTPNHPVLTESGWVPLGSVQTGDYLIGHSRQGQSPVTHHVEAHPSPICEVFDALTVAFDTVRVGTSRVDFHGDGRDGEVDIVGAYGQLFGRGESSADEFLRQLPLPLADVVSGSLDPEGAASPVLLGAGRSSYRVMGGARIGGSLFGGSGSGEESVSGGPPPGFDAVLGEQSPEGDAGPSDLMSQCLLGLSGQVTRQKVSHVGRVSVWEGHVFNLSTATGAYVCNSIIVHNCRCVLVAARSAG